MEPMEWFGFGLTVLSTATGVYASVKPMGPRERNLWINGSKAGAAIGVVLIIYSFATHRSGSQAGQTMTGSPGGVQVQGDNNTITRGLQDRRIEREDEFIQEMKAVAPVAVRLNTVDGREPESLQGQLYKLLIDSQWAVEAGGVFAGAAHWMNVSVAVRDKDHVPPAAIALVNQLRADGIESFLDVEKNLAAFENVDFIIRIGDQPPNNNE